MGTITRRALRETALRDTRYAMARSHTPARMTLRSRGSGVQIPRGAPIFSSVSACSIVPETGLYYRQSNEVKDSTGSGGIASYALPLRTLTLRLRPLSRTPPHYSSAR